MGKSNLLTYGRKLNDIGRVVVEAVYAAGGTDEDAERIFGGTLCGQIGQLVMGKLKLALHPCQRLAPELIPEGAEVLEDVEPTEFNVADLEFVSFLKEGEDYVNGDEMRSRAVGLKANLGLADGKRLLENQAAIPADLRGKYIVLAGTKLRRRDGILVVACLDWFGGGWCPRFFCLGYSWDDRSRLPRRKS